jgi:hypothetical protein
VYTAGVGSVERSFVRPMKSLCLKAEENWKFRKRCEEQIAERIDVRIMKSCSFEENVNYERS